MEYLKEESEINYSVKWGYIFCLLVLFVVISVYIGTNYYRPFHIMVEMISSFIGFCLLIMAINTYELSKNIQFLLIGVAFGISGGFNVIHILASNGMGFFQGDTTNLSMTISLIQRYITSITILISFRLYYKPNKVITPVTILLGFSIISAILLLSIFSWGIFPDSYIPGSGETLFKIVNEYIVSSISIASILILFSKRRYIGKNNYMLLQIYLCTTAISSVLYTLYLTQTQITNVLAHVLKAISFYCIYRAIVKVGIQAPYKMLFNELIYKDSSLKLKDSELKRTAYELQKESKLRKDIEELLLKNEIAYNLLIENSRDIIIIYSQNEIVFANEGAAKIVGVDKSEYLLGRIVTQFIEINTQNSKNDFKRTDTVDASYETELKTIDGEIIPVEVTNAYITYNNKPAVLSLIQDISPSKQIEKMKMAAEENTKLLRDTLEFNRLITEFFSNISHELRTPLNVILSALQVLGLNKHADATEKRELYIKSIKQNSYRLLRLINNLIDITRIDSGHISPKFQNHDIVSVVENITLSVAKYVEDKGIELIFDTDVEEKTIACDSEKIERIILNLISNAVKFTDKGDLIKVEILDKGHNIEIYVKDTGVGIPEDKLQLIFERFRQVDSSLSRNREGSGIGLSLVKAFVQMHNGNIAVESKIGEGSKFIINLPSKIIDDIDAGTENNIIYESKSEKVIMEFSDI